MSICELDLFHPLNAPFYHAFNARQVGSGSYEFNKHGEVLESIILGGTNFSDKKTDPQFGPVEALGHNISPISFDSS